jgi:hypothetical protein
MEASRRGHHTNVEQSVEGFGGGMRKKLHRGLMLDSHGCRRDSIHLL